MDGKPLVSIVIPVYNREELVKDAINSALAQTYDNVEVVVVDNCSTDSTWDVISNYKSPRIRVYRNEGNLGPVLNWRRGIELSKGEYIKLLFSDDMISNNYIEESLMLFDKETAFVLSPIQLLRDEVYEKPTHYSKKSYTTKEYFESFYSHFQEIFPVSPGAAIFRKKDIENAFIYDIPTMGELEPMKNGAGIDLLISFVIANKYNKIKVAEYTRAVFRSHKGSFSVTDTAIVHYYFRAMIYFIPFIDNRKLLCDFKTLLWSYSCNDHSYWEEYNMLKTDIINKLRLFYHIPFFYIEKLWCRMFRDNR